MHCFRIARHTQSMIAYMILLSISGKSSEKLPCGNVVNTPYFSVVDQRSWSETWKTIVPNSHLVIVPRPPDKPDECVFILSKLYPLFFLREDLAYPHF